MGDKNAIEVEGLVKNFRRVNIKGGYTSLKSVLLNPFAQYRKEGERVLKVLRGLDFHARQGEMVGLIGRNGSGKSTLLKIMAGIYKRTSGTVRLNGRVSALIELGAGFHPEFTGRENIFLYGIILGLSKAEVKRKFDQIVAFAELADYIDSPVRTYSSGMYVRLGFSVAVNVDPEILLIDEVMAVGDVGFRRKCEQKILEFKKEGRTMVLVSHDLDEVARFCGPGDLAQPGGHPGGRTALPGGGDLPPVHHRPGRGAVPGRLGQMGRRPDQADRDRDSGQGRAQPGDLPLRANRCGWSVAYALSDAHGRCGFRRLSGQGRRNPRFRHQHPSGRADPGPAAGERPGGACLWSGRT